MSTIGATEDNIVDMALFTKDMKYVALKRDLMALFTNGSRRVIDFSNQPIR
jgi:hypothetical protein